MRKSTATAIRPVFIPVFEGEALVRREEALFSWFAGFSLQQKQKSIAALHEVAGRKLGQGSILEVSRKSPTELGRSLSAFNLAFTTQKHQRRITVECAYQGSKRFEQGGPFVDIFGKTPKEAKQDERLRTSGNLLGFVFFGEQWELYPATAFYDWLYIKALS